MVEQLPVIKYGTVSGRFLAAAADSKADSDANPDGYPITGQVSFTPSVSALIIDSALPPVTVLPVKITADLDAAGYISLNGARGITLVATDDDNTNPRDFTYLVEFSGLKFTNADGFSTSVSYRAFSITIPAGTNTDLALTAPVPSSSGNPVVHNEGVIVEARQTTLDAAAATVRVAADVQVQHDATLVARNDAEAAQALSEAARDEAETARDVSATARDQSVAARDKALQVDALTVRTVAVQADGTLLATRTDGTTFNAGYIKGDKGNTGAVPNLQPGQVTTGAAGSAAAVTRSGPDEAPVFAFSIPQGAKGDKGDVGDTGDTAPYVTATQGTAALALVATGPRTTRLTLTGNPTLSIANGTASKSYTHTILLVQDGTGSRTITWPAGVKWSKGVKPTLSTAANAIDVVHLLWTGAEWVGFPAAYALA